MVPAKGFAENAICPTCKGYRLAEIIRRGVRRCCACGTEYRLRDTTTVQQARAEAKRNRDSTTD